MIQKEHLVSRQDMSVTIPALSCWLLVGKSVRGSLLGGRCVSVLQMKMKMPVELFSLMIWMQDRPDGNPAVDAVQKWLLLLRKIGTVWI